MVYKESVRATIMQMKPGDTLVIPWTACSEATVRNYACNLGLNGRRYKVSRDRKSATSTVTAL